jgi:hypothetical protein
MDFASLQHIRNRRSTCRGLCLPATFRPQGLVTLSTVSSLRSLAGFVSHRRRSWDSPFGAFSFRKAAGAFPLRRTHLPSPPAGVTTCRSRRPGSAGRGFWACPPGSPWRPAVCLARRPLEAPLGFPLPGFSRDSLDRDFAQPPLARFAALRSPAMRPASQSLDQPPPASARHPACKHMGASGGTLRGFLHRFNPNIRIRRVSGSFFHLTPRRSLLPTGRRSSRRVPNPTEVVGTA